MKHYGTTEVHGGIESHSGKLIQRISDPCLDYSHNKTRTKKADIYSGVVVVIYYIHSSNNSHRTQDVTGISVNLSAKDSCIS